MFSHPALSGMRRQSATNSQNRPHDTTLPLGALSRATLRENGRKTMTWVMLEDNQETEELERKLDDIVAKDMLDFCYMWDIDTPVFPFQEE